MENHDQGTSFWGTPVGRCDPASTLGGGTPGRVHISFLPAAVSRKHRQRVTSADWAVCSSGSPESLEGRTGQVRTVPFLRSRRLQGSTEGPGFRISPWPLSCALWVCPRARPIVARPKFRRSPPPSASRGRTTRSWLFSRPFRRPLLLLRVPWPGMPRPDPLRKLSSPV